MKSENQDQVSKNQDNAARESASKEAKKHLHFGMFLAMWNRREGLVTPRVHFKIARFLEPQSI